MDDLRRHEAALSMLQCKCENERDREGFRGKRSGSCTNEESTVLENCNGSECEVL